MLIRMMSRFACATAVLAAALNAVQAADPNEQGFGPIEPVFVETSATSFPGEGVAHVRTVPVGICRDACGPGVGNAPGSNCGPHAGVICGPNGQCLNGSYGNAGPYGACPPGGCPTLTTHGGLSAQCYAGRPYTLGDLGSDLRLCKSQCDEVNPLSCKNLGNCYQGSSLHSWWCNEKMKYECRRANRNQVWGAHLNNKLNYFTPSGNGGSGTPLFGMYRRVYATEPGYYDVRDKQVYGSPMTGVPTAIPLAPGVRHQYNYGWGTPSSRLTPISTIAPPRY